MTSVTRLGLAGVPTAGLSAAQEEALGNKNVASAIRAPGLVEPFDIWQPDYGGARVYIYKAGTDFPARVFRDVAMTDEAPNPQILLDRVGEDGTHYGKFTDPLYTPDAYYLDIDAVDQTGVHQIPLTSLDGADADLALVTAQGGNQARPLESHFGQQIWAADYGEIGSSPTTNTTTIMAAIGAAGARNGGYVMLPSGTIEITQISIPAGVILCGWRRGATVLVSAVAGRVVTLAGDLAGLQDLTLDGVNVVADSTGLYAEEIDDLYLLRVEIKRFEKNVHINGGQRGAFYDVAISGAQYGVHLQGDAAEVRDFRWLGGVITTCQEIGLWLENDGEPVWHSTFERLICYEGTDDAIRLTGALFTRFYDVSIRDYDDAVAIEDVTPAGVNNETLNVQFRAGYVERANLRFDGQCQDVQFEDMGFSAVEFIVATTTRNQITLIDCLEDSDVRISGDGTKIQRWRVNEDGAVAGTTADATATKAIAIAMEPGEVVAVEVTATANQVDGEGHGVWRWTHAARRDTADLAYDGGTVAIGVGTTIAGGTSGATAYVTAVSGTTASGTLSLRAISGTFQDNEAIQVAGVTRAFVNGNLSNPSVSVMGSLADHFSESVGMTGADNLLVAVSNEAQVQVQGVVGRTFEWNVKARVTKG
ncbi:MAG: hypothetical protein AB7P02_06545 [Alphaproteobacteria bacterium]